MLTQQRLKELLSYDPQSGEFTWLVQRGGRSAGGPTGCGLKDGYRSIRVDRTLFRAHRLAWLYMTGAWPDAFVDHRNADRSDNRWVNLRQASRGLNNQNLVGAKSHSKTQVLGVTRSPNGKRFRASLQVCGKQMYLGCFDSAEKAHAVYVEAKRQFHAGCTL